MASPVRRAARHPVRAAALATGTKASHARSVAAAVAATARRTDATRRRVRSSSCRPSLR